MKNINFARTMWANIQLAKLCPGNDIGRLEEIMNTNVFVKQMDTAINIILILKESYDRRAKYEDKSYEAEPLTRTDLEMLNEEELLDLLNKAFETFGVDGETTVETEPVKKGKNEASPSN
jgi:hypothetical protein